MGNSGDNGLQLSELALYNSGAPTSPPAPTGLTATAVSSSQINLSWTASSGATSYKVKRATVNGGPYTTIAIGVTTTYSDTGLAASTTYYYVVSVVNSSGESANSTQVFVVVAPVYYPSFGNIVIGQTNGVPSTITLTGTGGPPGGSYPVLSATNITMPMAAWIPVQTNQFDSDGAFSNTIPVDATEPTRFYRLSQP
jgi:cellulose 1,4-beta-cellobiosidase